MSHGTDIDIIACRRKLDAPDNRVVFGVRWALRPELGFPPNGFYVLRVYENGEADPVFNTDGPLLLPGVVMNHGVATVDKMKIIADARARRPDRSGEAPFGPYFPDDAIPMLVSLAPVLRFAAPRVDRAERLSALNDISSHMGDTHLENTVLSELYWRTGKYPTIDEIKQGDPTRLHDVMSFYREAAVRNLLALAVRFEYAKFLGLGWDDLLPEGLIDQTKIRYRLIVGEGSVAETDPLDGNSVCDPDPPSALRIEPRLGRPVEHPLFAAFKPGKPDAWPRKSQGLPPFCSGDRFPCAPAYAAALFWESPIPPRPKRLLTHGPVLYQVERLQPPVQGQEFEVLPGASRVILRKPPAEGPPPPAWIDAPSMQWPPMEGECSYRVRGVDLFGVVGSRATEDSVTLVDDLSPPPPRLGGSPPLALDVDGAAQRVSVPIEILWDSREDFAAPDCAGFRVAVTWSLQTTRPVIVTRIDHEKLGELSHVQADVTLGDPLAPKGAAIPRDVGRTLAGCRLVTPSSQFLILRDEPTTLGATVRVRKSAGLAPSPGDAVVYATEAASNLVHCSAENRRSPIALTIADAQLEQRGSRPRKAIAIRVSPIVDGTLPPSEALDLYLHFFGASFAATPQGPDLWLFEDLEDRDPRAAMIDQLDQIPNWQAAIMGSPVIAYPRHPDVLSIAIPTEYRGEPIDFHAGVLDLHVTATDGKPNRPPTDTSGLPGNVSAPVSRRIVIRRKAPPPAPKPSRGVKWAKPGARYADDATYELTWERVPGAARYEVERVLEGHFGYQPNALSDDDLRDLAARRLDLFERRSNQVIGPRFTDRLPGRAPTRSLYRVRAISDTEEAGPWSEAIGPIRVPDVRIAPPPNLLRATAPPVVDDRQRRLRLEWTQGGPLDDLGFVVEVSDGAGNDGWRLVADYLPGMLAAEENARFVAELVDQVPGKPTQFRVVAVRHALDPADPWGLARTRIRGLESNEVTAMALGELRPPTDLAARYLGDGAIELTWRNRDEYRWIEVRRRAPGAYGFTRSRCDGDRQRFSDALPAGAKAGEWHYELVAIGYGRQAHGGDIVLTV
ncbi:hypothetical protein GCM10007856_04040 [Azospirillum oryzae]|nr:hypothetical protein GCM10007856_04040 [Azospirillum oryzae]